MKRKYFALIFTIISLVFSQSAFAGRFGGGKSRGMQRSQPSYSKNMNNNNSPKNNYNAQPNTNGAQQRSGMGAGTAAALGAAAGAAGGYMLGKSMANEKQAASSTVANTQEQPAQTGNLNNVTQTESKIPWGVISILGILLVIGLMFFRKKSRPEFQNPNAFNNGSNNAFSIPNIQKNNSAAQFNTQMSSNSNDAQNIDDKMPDGIEKMYFLRQAKGMFLHIQSMNNPENLNEISKYLTPDLYNEIKDEIANNHVIADFPVLDCSLVSANVENNQLFASVNFTGTVSESPDQPTKPFFETWNFVKTDLTNNKWLVAGIQQSASTNA
jgi:predicted lipid-binding transport protein (Tim44 family)